jgi:hypothetical protein
MGAIHGACAGALASLHSSQSSHISYASRGSRRDVGICVSAEHERRCQMRERYGRYDRGATKDWYRRR